MLKQFCLFSGRAGCVHWSKSRVVKEPAGFLPDRFGACTSRNRWKHFRLQCEYTTDSHQKGSWYTPPGPKLPPGDEIDYLEPVEAIGHVISAEANFLRVRLLQSSSGDIPRDELLCVVRRLLKKMNKMVLVGDRVRVVRVDWVDGRGMVDEILPRKSELLDPGVANIDNISVLLSAANPPFDEYQATRFLLAAEATGVPVSLIINKVDLLEEEECTKLLKRVKGWGYKPLPLSVSEGSGIKLVSRRLRNRVSVVVGPSGVGKSSLINYLRRRGRTRGKSKAMLRSYPDVEGAVEADNEMDNKELFMGFAEEEDADAENEMPDKSERHHGENGESNEASHQGDENKDVDGNLEWMASMDTFTNRGEGEINEEDTKVQSVQEVSSIGRGKHTTRTISFLDLPGGGLLADTPGFNMPDLTKVTSKNLAELFPEIETRLLDSSCRFRNCNHINEPGCVVRGDWERYPIYCRLFEEIRQKEMYEEKHLQMGKKTREGNIKVKSGKGGGTKTEVKLNTKKFRRPSRRSKLQELQAMIKEESWDDFEDEDEDAEDEDSLDYNQGAKSRKKKRNKKQTYPQGTLADFYGSDEERELNDRFYDERVHRQRW